MIRLTQQARGHWSVAFRIVAGAFGAYTLTSLVTVALSLLLARIGMGPVEAVTAATLASFAIFAGVAMAAFHARSAARRGRGDGCLVLSLRSACCRGC